MSQAHPLAEPFDAAVGELDPPMIIVTTAAGDQRAGCLVGFHAQCSIEPRRYSVWLSKANHTLSVAFHAEHLAVHFLAQDDRDLAELFGTTTGDDFDKFAHCDWSNAADDIDVPLLDRCGHRLVLRRTALLDEGSDHVCIVGEPVLVHTAAPIHPLRLSDVTDLRPGHEATDHEESPQG